VVVWWLYLKLPLQSVLITTKVVSSNPVHGKVWSIQHYVIVCKWLAIGRWFSLGTPVSSTNKTDRHDITKILLKVALSTINQTNQSMIIVEVATPLEIFCMFCTFMVNMILMAILLLYVSLLYVNWSCLQTHAHHCKHLRTCKFITRTHEVKLCGTWRASCKSAFSHELQMERICMLEFVCI
jgi:hypothetical protein